MIIRRPIIFIFILFTAGIILSSFFNFPFWAAIALLTALLLLSLKFEQRPLAATVFILAAVLIMGFVYAQSHRAAECPMRYVGGKFAGETVYLEGTIDSPVERKKVFRTQKIAFTLSASHIQTSWGWRQTEGKILINLFRDVPLRYGDHVIIQGKLHYPFEFDEDGKFSYRNFLGRKGIRFILSSKKTAYIKVLNSGEGNWFYSQILKCRDKGKEIFNRYLSPAEAGLMQAMIVGDTSQIPKSINDLYIRTGTAHILAISGFNVGIMMGVVFLFLRLFPIGRKKQILLTILFLILYAILAGARPPVVRATIMATVFLLSFIFERETDGLNSLFVAALLILLMNPFNIEDVGFQLSFISVLFIILFMPAWRTACPDVSWPVIDQGFRWLSQSLLLSVTAWVGVAGLIAYYFDIFTPVSVAANLAVVPLSTAIVVLGVGLMFFGLFWPFMAACFAACSKLILNLMIYCIYLCDQIPFSSIYLKSISYWHVIGYYGFITLIALGFLRRGLTK